MSLKLDAKFLIVDDYASVRQVIISQLRDLDFDGSFLEAESAAEADALLDQHEDIDFVISDWNMPEKTGVELAREIRKHPTHGNLPILMITTVNEKEVVLEAIQAGVNNYLLKPWKIEDLADKIKKCCIAQGKASE